MPAVGLQAFVSRQDTPYNRSPSRESSHGRNSPLTRPSISNGQENLAERQRKAEYARIRVPHTLPNAEPPANINDLAGSVASRPSSRHQQYNKQHRGTFDDTDTTIGTFSTFSDDEQCVGDEHYADQYGEYMPHQEDSKPKMSWDDNNIMSQVREARRAFKGRRPPVFDDLQHGEEEDYAEGANVQCMEEMEEDGDNITAPQTPTRIRHVKVVPVQHDKARPMSETSMPPPPPQPNLGPRLSSKTSSTVEIPKGNIPLASPPAKRHAGELDYETETLQKLSYGDLERQVFDIDPRATEPAPSFSAHGVPLSLKEKLGHLKHMKEENVKELLSAQSTEDWEETGFWFLAQLDEQMKRVMELRQERRKTALRFEMKVKKRQAAVVAKTDDVEKELSDLGAGSRKLLENRPIAVRSTMNTPIR